MRRPYRKGAQLVERIAAMEEWMRQYGSAALREQRHLKKDSIERTYWNYGYLMALREMLDLVTDQNDRPGDLGKRGVSCSSYPSQFPPPSHSTENECSE